MYEEKIEGLIDHNPDMAILAQKIYSTDPEISVYLIREGLKLFARRRQAKIKQLIKRDHVFPKPIYEIRISPKNAKIFKTGADRVLRGIFASWTVGRDKIPLGNCTKEMLMKEAARLRKISDGMNKAAEFQEELAKPMKDDDIVVQVWSEKDVETLRDDIWGKAFSQDSQPPRDIGDSGWVSPLV